jgi:hypothetical protein
MAADIRFWQKEIATQRRRIVSRALDQRAPAALLFQAAAGLMLGLIGLRLVEVACFGWGGGSMSRAV